MRRIICVLLVPVLLGTTACSAEIIVKPAKPADGGKILDGRWLNPDIIGNVTKDTPAELKDNFAL